MNEAYEGPRNALWIYGKAGIGKSRYAKGFRPYMKANNKWWDGYVGEDIVLMDDLEMDCMKYLGHFLKIWGDPYGKIVGEIKGGHTKLCYSRLIVTSNYLPWEMTEDKELIRAIVRRYYVIEMKRDSWSAIDWD